MMQMPRLKAAYQDAAVLVAQQIAPSTIFSFCASAAPGEVIGRYMFPLAGSFGMATIVVDSLKEGSTDEGYIEIEEVGKTGPSYKFSVKPGKNPLDYITPVERGTRIVLVNIGDKVLEGVWICFMYKPGIVNRA